MEWEKLQFPLLNIHSNVQYSFVSKSIYAAAYIQYIHICQIWRWACWDRTGAPPQLDVASAQPLRSSAAQSPGTWHLVAGSGASELAAGGEKNYGWETCRAMWSFLLRNVKNDKTLRIVWEDLSPQILSFTFFPSLLVHQRMQTHAALPAQEHWITLVTILMLELSWRHWSCWFSIILSSYQIIPLIVLFRFSLSGPASLTCFMFSLFSLSAILVRSSFSHLCPNL